MSVKFFEVMKRLEYYRYELAVWSNIESHLCSLIDRDDHRVSNAALQVAGCSEAYVPQDIVQGVIDRIREEEIEPLTGKITEIESLSVEDEDGHEESRPKHTAEEPQPKKIRTVRTRSRKADAGPG